MSQTPPFTSDTPNWYGTMTSTISGAGAASVGGGYEWDINFVINPDNSISGTATGKGSVEVQASQGAGTATPSGQLKVTGNYDPGSGNINLVFNLVDIAGAIEATSPTGSGSGEMSWVPTDLQLLTPNMDSVISPILQNDLTTITAQDGQSTTVTEPADLTQADNSWSAPPVPKQDGATVTKTVTYPGITVTSVLTIYQSIQIQRSDSQDSTFITTDSPEFTVVVKVAGYDPNSANWDVSADSQYAGDPTPAGATGASYFTFNPQSPSDNPITGAQAPNDPLQYKLQVTVGNLVATSELTQDEIDTIRQEYVDYNAVYPLPPFATGIPDRAAFVLDSSSLNKGNYDYVLDGGLQNHLNTVTQQFNALAQGAIAVSSGYRNPQRNVAAYWIAPGNVRGNCTYLRSRHVWGRALDLTVNPANGNTWQSLCNAGAQGNHLSQCEDGPGHGAPGGCRQAAPPITHVHVDW